MYKRQVSDDNVLEATIDAGKIKIKTKKNGIVYLVVKAKTEHTSVTIRVKVVDSYLGCLLYTSPMARVPGLGRGRLEISCFEDGASI